MALSNKNWTLNSYTVDTWTDLIAEDESIIASLIIANTNASSDVTVQIRVTDNTPTSRAVILPGQLIAAGDAEVLDMRSLYLSSTDHIQIQCDVSGVEFMVSGVEVTV